MNFVHDDFDLASRRDRELYSFIDQLNDDAWRARIRQLKGEMRDYRRRAPLVLPATTSVQSNGYSRAEASGVDDRSVDTDPVLSPSTIDDGATEGRRKKVIDRPAGRRAQGYMPSGVTYR